MAKSGAAFAIVILLAIAACATTQNGYSICDDRNTVCPSNTANVVVVNQ